ncbi:MAG: hypothetical protein HYT62_02485 [Candidatus Yanofskybacteria bacterium]|nr:hypothetical protein [Candidatus Yanofskybacteria bacterium]
MTEAVQSVWSDKDQETLRVFNSKVSLCGCGSATEWDIVKLLLERSRDIRVANEKESTDKPPCFYDSLDGAPGKWVEFGAKVIDHWGLLEHGVGIGHAWLTDEGELLLRFLSDFGTDSDKWPEWSL